MADIMVILNPEEVDAILLEMMAGSCGPLIEICAKALPYVSRDEIRQRVDTFQVAICEEIKADAKWSIKFKEEKGQ